MALIHWQPYAIQFKFRMKPFLSNSKERLYSLDSINDVQLRAFSISATIASTDMSA
jgi:hypothetical protein